MNDLVIKDNIKIEDLIYEVRSKQVMLDSDLAVLYGCKNGTKEINQAVKNNMSKFPDRYCFLLNDEEYSILRSKDLTTKYSNISVFIHTGFHDIFIILDKSILYHCGSSFKDLGVKCFAINRIDDFLLLDSIINYLK